jgi:hypothetical protein
VFSLQKDKALSWLQKGTVMAACLSRCAGQEKTTFLLLMIITSMASMAS